MLLRSWGHPKPFGDLKMEQVEEDLHNFNFIGGVKSIIASAKATVRIRQFVLKSDR